MPRASVALPSGISAWMPVSKDTAAVRGMANSGPMARAQIIVMARAYSGCMGIAIESGLSLFFIAIAKTPISGKPTPLKQKPSIPSVKFSPASCPSTGGKIKLPAPKKKENSMRPIGIIRDNGSLFCCIISPRQPVSEQALLVIFVTKAICCKLAADGFVHNRLILQPDGSISSCPCG